MEIILAFLHWFLNFGMILIGLENMALEMQLKPALIHNAKYSFSTVSASQK
jgi:hypothetical protein